MKLTHQDTTGSSLGFTGQGAARLIRGPAPGVPAHALAPTGRYCGYYQQGDGNVGFCIEARLVPATSHGPPPLSCLMFFELHQPKLGPLGGGAVDQAPPQQAALHLRSSRILGTAALHPQPTHDCSVTPRASPSGDIPGFRSTLDHAEEVLRLQLLAGWSDGSLTSDGLAASTQCSGSRPARPTRIGSSPQARGRRCRP